MASVLAPDDVRKMEQAATNLRDLLILRIGYLYGVRRSEIIGIEAPKPQDLKNHRVRVPVFKRERDWWRWIPLDDTTRRYLERYIRELKLKPGDVLFPVSARTCTRVINNLAERAGIARLTPPDGAKRETWGVSPHRLRDFSITRRLTDESLQAKGMEGLKAVAEFHGHRDPRSTLHYLRLTGEWREDVFNAGMGELLEPEGQSEQAKEGA